ncbi:hypothetical protein TUM22923_02460 [Polynucleobacter sp. TUM22923]|jgi:hypothetical protein|uniref:DUF5672 family protein n=1 Tax=Polynucleobacter sp. TUM22923 TaxID=3022126 RepID=UPI0025723A21|nr:DUF5672 family protein [Polynucleobacter sp. TUM22923]BDX20925.1 hypothetical protein TUM22923_02460 [Polynucleobacter sp. TUM22923]
MLNLSQVTLLCVETREPELAHWAIDRCLSGASFCKVVLITSLDKVKSKRAGIDYVQAPPIATTKDYSDLLLTGIDAHVQGTHVLIIQWDSFITHPNLWQEDFLNYDYIGPVWPHHPQTPVGNGGFSLRSVKLLQAIKRPGFIKKHPEDYCICVDNKDFLGQECGIKFAPASIAEQFAVERSEWHDAFGFHGFFNFARVLDDEDLVHFLKLLPDSYLKGVDAYDLVNYLLTENKLKLALLVGSRVQFSWKYKKRYLLMKIQITAKQLASIIRN